MDDFMAHKTFISYKYSEATGLRDAIIKKLGSDATYYQGETSSSPDLSDLKTNTIRQKLADMIYDTTVMIVIVSPNMTKSSWMEWEIKYALREQSRNGRTSHSNGLVCVIQKNAIYEALGLDPYSWAKLSSGGWSASVFFDILVKNMRNKKTWIDSPIPSTNKALYDSLSDSYIDIVTEEAFLRAPSYYIDKAFEKSENVGSYNIAK
jgi:hypothetical protein